MGLVLGAAFLTAMLWGESVHARAAHRASALPPIQRGDSVVLVVLGFGNPGDRPNAVNRWRARIAVRTALALVRQGARVRIIASGGAVHGETAEGELLRRHISGVLGWSGHVLVEDRSSSTWENVREVVPWLDGADRIVFASNGLHAEKARTYLRRQRPDLAARLAAADDYRAGEMVLLKPLFAAVGLKKLRDLRSID